MPVIAVEDIYKAYKKRASRERVQAVGGVSFEVGVGEIVGLLGPNGAGKTTTIKMICGLIRPDQGRVLVNGYDNRRDRLRALRHISAVLEGNRNLYWRLTVRENLEYFAGNRGRSRAAVRDEINALLAQFQLAGKVAERVNNLSRGMQQKLAIVVALLADTEVILLDEPTLGLDVETGYEVREHLRQIAASGRTVIISSHDMATVQAICERTVIINAGRVVVDDKVANLLKLFETRAYEVRLGATLSSRQEAKLEQLFPVLTLSDERRTLKVTLEQDGDIYKLMDVLGSERSPVEAIDRTNINFEGVFRRLVNGEGAARV